MAEPHPVRLQLARKIGFNLQALSRATNGLPAVNVARPSKWGNEFYLSRDDVGWVVCDRFDQYVARAANKLGARHIAVNKFRDRIEAECAADPQAAGLMWKRLRGRNLACWCELPAPSDPDICHGAVWLDLANRPICEAA